MYAYNINRFKQVIGIYVDFSIESVLSLGSFAPLQKPQSLRNQGLWPFLLLGEIRLDAKMTP
jgi:hypothetical protein